jgi:protein-S-isoprenylcysteine O-methyltransferase Ste14
MYILKIYLPLYLLAYIIIAFVVPTYRTFKKTGINPITFAKTDNAHDYIGFVMKLLIALLFFAVLCFSFSDKLYYYMIPISYLSFSAFKIIGLILIHSSLIWIGIAQYQMSNSWRIGIDEKNKTDLVTKGIFSVSRNPIFLGMIISVLGLFMIVPTALSFCLLITTYFIIQIQIRLEEDFLEKQHSQTYINYKLKTKRLI